MDHYRIVVDIFAYNKQVISMVYCFIPITLRGRQGDRDSDTEREGERDRGRGRDR